jgi:hypothetical protein
MSGICSAHMGHDPKCGNCAASTPEEARRAQEYHGAFVHGFERGAEAVAEWLEGAQWDDASGQPVSTDAITVADERLNAVVVSLRFAVENFQASRCRCDASREAWRQERAPVENFQASRCRYDLRAQQSGRPPASTSYLSPSARVESFKASRCRCDAALLGHASVCVVVESFKASRCRCDLQGQPHQGTGGGRVESFKASRCRCDILGTRPAR